MDHSVRVWGFLRKIFAPFRLFFPFSWCASIFYFGFMGLVKAAPGFVRFSCFLMARCEDVQDRKILDGLALMEFLWLPQNMRRQKTTGPPSKT
jgi:hypothetical protein